MSNDRAHARLSASGAYIWLNCTMSPVLSNGIERRSSKWADEGTRAHALAEDLVLGREPEVPDDKMSEWVKPYVDYVADLARRTPLHRVEQRVSLDRLWTGALEDPPEEMFGTADFVALTPDKVLHVVDLKYGAGVPVEVRDNPQLLYYALGSMLGFPSSIERPLRVRMTIVQPRAAHPEGPVRSWEIPTVDLWHWAHETLKPTVEKIAAGNPDELTLNEGKHCRWCPAQTTTCPVKRRTKQEQAKHDFEDINL